MGGELLGAQFSFNGSSFEHTYYFGMDATGSTLHDLNYASYRQVGNVLTFYDFGNFGSVGGDGMMDQNRLTFHAKSYSWVLAPSVESYVAW